MNITTAEKIVNCEIRENESYEMYRLEERKVLTAKKVNTKTKIKTIMQVPTKKTYQIKEVIEKNEEEVAFLIKKIEKSELAEKRESTIPSFVIKENGKYYYSEIREKMSFLTENILGNHKCKECQRLSALSDEQGGCAKVRKRNAKIEDFEFIEVGYESFATKQNSLVVTCCKNFEPILPKPKISKEEVEKKKNSLAWFYWDDATSIEEMKKLRRKGLKKGNGFF